MIAVVVEAEDLTRAFARAILEGEGFEVVEASTALEGVALAVGADLVVSGLDLVGRLDGVDLVRAVRAARGAAVLASELPPTCDAVQSVTKTGARHLSKPYTPGGLGLAIRSALGPVAAASLV